MKRIRGEALENPENGNEQVEDKIVENTGGK